MQFCVAINFYQMIASFLLFSYYHNIINFVVALKKDSHVMHAKVAETLLFRGDGW